MKTPQNIQPSFDDEISIADIIHFFKSHKKMILIFVIIGTLLGGLYGNFAAPVYKGSILISPAKVSGVFVVNPKVTVTKLDMNSYYSKETFLNCNPDFYKDKNKDKDKDKDIDYDISSMVKASVTKDGDLIQLLMQNKNKTVIKDCLNSMFDDIRANQNMITEPLIQLKNIELTLLEEKLKNAEEFKAKLNEKQISELKTNGERFSVDLLYTNMILFNSKDIKETITEINKVKIDLSPEQTKPASNLLPISIEKKSFPTPKLGALIGLFLGLCLGILIALIKQMKI
jgi:LPS O-antigen subunit length determinant protein (WzzB/FepE family)